LFLSNVTIQLLQGSHPSCLMYLSSSFKGPVPSCLMLYLFSSSRIPVPSCLMYLSSSYSGLYFLSIVSIQLVQGGPVPFSLIYLSRSYRGLVLSCLMHQSSSCRGPVSSCRLYSTAPAGVLTFLSGISIQLLEGSCPILSDFMCLLFAGKSVLANLFCLCRSSMIF
jgi:hypothetical protein